MHFQLRPLCALLAIALAAFCAARTRGADDRVLAARESVRAEDLRRHIQVLADDTFEGREAGSRGGRAAGVYLGKEFQRHRLAGAGTAGSFYQAFGAGYRNILGWLEGSDPTLRNEVIILGAHYDHVGYGNARNSYGPTGYIHNGADDNASGVAGLLETLEAFAQLDAPPKRSILFALWDGEEKGLLGSKHWVAQPTVPLASVALAVNLDMIGRLNKSGVDVYGSRSAHGLRRVVSLQNEGLDLLLRFKWEMRDDSDHHSFYERGIPILMLHTGLHPDYHRPSDDVERIDFVGTERIARLLFQTVYELADQNERTRFRPAGRLESPYAQRQFEQPLAPLPGRLGVQLAASPAGEAGVRLASVDYNSPAARASLQVGDRLIALDGAIIETQLDLRRMLSAADKPVVLTVERAGQAGPLQLTVQLAGTPIRIGITWRTDEAAPDCVVISRVVPGTPAEAAGLAVNDYVYQVSGQAFANQDEFLALLKASPSPLELVYERNGRVRTATVIPFETQRPDQPAGGAATP